MAKKVADKNEPKAQTDAPLRVYSLPEYGVSVEAHSAAEAVEKAKKLKGSK